MPGSSPGVLRLSVPLEYGWCASARLSAAGAVDAETLPFGQGAATAEIASSVNQAANGVQAVTDTIGDVEEAAIATESAAAVVAQAADQLSTRTDDLRRIVHDFLTRVKAA
jgi:hypothetical protein